MSDTIPVAVASSKFAAKQNRFGPGLLVTAAFIGPGTVITASKAGAEFGTELLWAVLLSVLGAIVLQSLAARLGIVSQGGLGELLREALRESPLYYLATGLVISAIGVGNAAYQVGNLTGAATGLSHLLGGELQWWIVVLALFAATLLMVGNYQWLQRALIVMVAGLSLTFLFTALGSRTNWADIWMGCLVPRLSWQSLNLVLALIGTTIVPYNLFLHASSAAQNWKNVDSEVALRESNSDTIVAISLGGLVTASIVLTANAAFHTQGKEIGSIGEIAQQLQPTLGSLASAVFALGLFAAGLTSAITAPLATGFAVCGVLGWNTNVACWHFRFIVVAVIAAAAGLALAFGKAPTQTIVFAQVANGLLLPLVACFLLFAASRIPMAKWRSPSILIISYGVVIGVSMLALFKLFQLFS